MLHHFRGILEEHRKQPKGESERENRHATLTHTHAHSTDPTRALMHISKKETLETHTPTETRICTTKCICIYKTTRFNTDFEPDLGSIGYNYCLLLSRRSGSSRACRAEQGLAQRTGQKQKHYMPRLDKTEQRRRRRNKTKP